MGDPLSNFSHADLSRRARLTRSSTEYRRGLMIGLGVVLAASAALAGCGSSASDDTTAATSETSSNEVESTPSTTATTRAAETLLATSESAPSTSASVPSTQLEAVPSNDGELPTSAQELAVRLVEAEQAIRNTSLSTEARSAWGRYQQSLYAVLSFRPEWEQETMESTTSAPGSDAEIATAIETNWTAREHLDALVEHHGVTDELPAWRIKEPLPADELLSYYREAEAATGIDWTYVAAINVIETRVGRISGVSTAGAVGPMQFLPSTWNDCCTGDPTNDRDAIIGGATYLVNRGGPDNMDKAIFGYNRSDDYVGAVKAYASVMATNEEAYYGYHGWQIYFRTTEGPVVLPVGYERSEPISAATWLADNPDALFQLPIGD